MTIDNNRTIITWSMNEPSVSRKYEIGAPTFERRLNAAKKVQDAGYRVRIRIDPVVPTNNWKTEYAGTIRQIFETISPERVTIGTLRFEKGFYNMRNSLCSSGSDLPKIIRKMEPMFEPKLLPNMKKPKIGKYSFPEQQRAEIFKFIRAEVRKYSNCTLALCKESEPVWKQAGLNPSRCACVCQLDYVDMSIN